MCTGATALDPCTPTQQLSPTTVSGFIVFHLIEGILSISITGAKIPQVHISRYFTPLDRYSGDISCGAISSFKEVFIFSFVHLQNKTTSLPMRRQTAHFRLLLMKDTKLIHLFYQTVVKGINHYGYKDAI